MRSGLCLYPVSAVRVIGREVMVDCIIEQHPEVTVMDGAGVDGQATSLEVCIKVLQPTNGDTIQGNVIGADELANLAVSLFVRGAGVTLPRRKETLISGEQGCGRRLRVAQDRVPYLYRGGDIPSRIVDT